MFWTDNELTLKRGARIHLPPPIPVTDWVKPTEPPNLSGATVISFDTETKDLTLNSEGPGWARGKAHIVGVSIGAQDALGNRGAWYFPIRHELEPQDNLNPAHVLPWLSSVLDTPHVPKIGANLTYDIGNLAAEGVRVSGPLNDIQFAEALIDNEAFVALEIQARKYLGYGKTSDALKEWCMQAYPYTLERYWRGNIHRTPPRLTGPYAIGDAVLPIDIFNKQWPILDAAWLSGIYRIECDLIPLMVAMRFAGISVDVKKAERLIGGIEEDTRQLYAKLYREYGYNLTSTSPGNLSKLFDHVGIRYGKTAAGNPSFQKEWLKGLEHPLADLINDIREHEKMVSTFLKGYVIDKNINGKLHPQFHQLKNDKNGTDVGRFASSDPNLQNIPARTKLGKKIRSVFICDEGHDRWTKFDQSQVHYRILANYAVGQGSDELREKYNNDPAIDYHRTVYNNVAPLRNWSLTDEEEIKDHRRLIKNINFSGLYGVGLGTIKYKYLIGMSDAEVKAFMEDYYKAAPYIKPTTQAIGREVQQYGFVTTLLGRRVYFNEWEPSNYKRIQALKETGEYYGPMSYESAMNAYGPPIHRAYEYRGVNYKFQGSEPDIIKSGLLDCWNSGVFHEIGVPRVTVHDENNWSVPDNSPRTRQALEFIRHTMISSVPRRVPFRVPLKVDEEAGPSWGEVKEVILN
jgi:DNA polymerase I-like protein with 3'-5' exonuclease and polymerase domains